MFFQQKTEFRSAAGVAIPRRLALLSVMAKYWMKRIATVFNEPHSYTGENVVELSCHGGLYLTQEILRVILENGARLAEAGEFTKRAFLNGKMSLSQAEAVRI